jgi:hypothetical protein
MFNVSHYDLRFLCRYGNTTQQKFQALVGVAHCKVPKDETM